MSNGFRKAKYKHIKRAKGNKGGKIKDRTVPVKFDDLTPTPLSEEKQAEQDRISKLPSAAQTKENSATARMLAAIAKDQGAKGNYKSKTLKSGETIHYTQEIGKNASGKDVIISRDKDNPKKIIGISHVANVEAHMDKYNEEVNAIDHDESLARREAMASKRNYDLDQERIRLQEESRNTAYMTKEELGFDKDDDVNIFQAGDKDEHGNIIQHSNVPGKGLDHDYSSYDPKLEGTTHLESRRLAKEALMAKSDDDIKDE